MQLQDSAAPRLAKQMSLACSAKGCSPVSRISDPNSLLHFDRHGILAAKHSQTWTDAYKALGLLRLSTLAQGPSGRIQPSVWVQDRQGGHTSRPCSAAAEPSSTCAPTVCAMMFAHRELDAACSPHSQSRLGRRMLLKRCVTLVHRCFGRQQKVQSHVCTCQHRKAYVGWTQGAKC